MSSRVSPASVLATLTVLASGCSSTVGDSAVLHTSTQRRLVAVAIQRAANTYTPPDLSGRRVHLNARAIGPSDAINSLREKLEGAGAEVVAQETSTLTLEVTAETSGVRTQHYRLGIPGFVAWGADGTHLTSLLPDLLHAEELHAWAKVCCQIYDTKTRETFHRSPELRGRARFGQWSSLGFGPFPTRGQTLPPEPSREALARAPALATTLQVGQVAPVSSRALVSPRTEAGEASTEPKPTRPVAPTQPLWVPQVQARVASVATVHSASAHWQVRFDVLALPSPPQELSPLSSMIRGVAGTHGTPGLQVATRQFGLALGAANDGAARAVLESHGARVLTRVQAALAPQARIALELKLPDGAHCTLAVERRGGDSIEPSLLLDGEEGVEVALLKATPLQNDEAVLVLVIPRTGYALALWAHVAPASALGDPARALHDQAVAALGCEIPGWAAVGERATPLATDTATPSPRAELLRHAQRVKAPLAESLALAADDALVAALGESAPAATKAWPLERKALELCLNACKNGGGPAWLRGTLARRLGAASHAWLRRCLERTSQLGAFDEGLLTENRRKLSSSRAGVRALAHRWLDARGAAVQGYRALGAKADRERALGATEAQGQ